MKDVLNIVLVLKAGKDFTFADVELLSYHLNKWNKNIKVTCLFDKIQNNIDLKGLQLIPMEHKWGGWWSKMNLFSPKLEYLRPFLFMDLDTAIIGDYNCVIPKNENDFITLRDFYRPTKLAGGMMWIPARNKKISDIWYKWIVDPTGHIGKLRGENNLIEKATTPDGFFQDYTDRIGTFKPGSKWLREFPENLSIVCFHGKPRIPIAAKTVPWVTKYFNNENI